MTLHLSRPFEDLELESSRPPAQVHTLIVGSGYGAALSAIALAMRADYRNGGKRIMVIERGNEFVPGDFPKTLSDLPANVSVRRNGAARTGYADALFDVRFGENVIAIVGNGLGGTSLINAGVAVDPDDSALKSFPPPLDGGVWSQCLTTSLRFVRTLLGVGPHPRGHELDKVAALKRIADALPTSGGKKSGVSVHHRLADIAVTFQDGENAVGVVQSKCNDCGNCFTGCNIGAKNTLALNAWPLAHSLGVELFTGGTVDFVRHGGPAGEARDWVVHAHRTTDMTATAAVEIHAQCVILAAGTFGSTEILKRSSRRGLPVSKECLGTRFSLNGDGIGFGYGQRAAVKAAAKVPSAPEIDPGKAERPGPTIVSMIDVRASGSHGLLQDCTVPQAITRLWAEALSTQALMRGFVEDNTSAWHRDHASADPLAVSPPLMDHHQMVLGMHDDRATGKLEFVDPGAGLASAGLDIFWPGGSRKRGNPSPGGWIDEQLSGAEGRRGFDGGLYLANPFLKPLPDTFAASIVGASEFGATHVCAHPLGGCPMAVDASEGVVNARGQVFRGVTGDAVHEGLYVLDGSIVPGALGINPYMTIGSLAHHLAQRIDIPAQLLARRQKTFADDDSRDRTVRDEANPWTALAAADCPVPRISTAPVAIPRKSGQVIDWPIPPLSFEFRERLFTTALKPDTEAAMALLGLPPNDDDRSSLVIDATITFADFYRWLEDPSTALPARFSVYHNVHADHTIDTVPEKDLDTPIGASTHGSVQLFARDAKIPTLRRWWRSILAFRRFYALRRNEILDSLRGGSSASANRFELIRIFLRALGQAGRWRYLNYRFDTVINGRQLRVQGQKRLAYDGSRDRIVRDEANPWTAFANIEMVFLDLRSRQRASAWFRVDVLRMARDISPLQIISGAETPQVALGVSCLGALAARVLLQTHAFSVGSPSYQYFPTRATLEKEFALHQPPSAITYLDGGPTPERYPVECLPRPGGQEWRLLRVTPAGARHRAADNPILLIHGMAHSSRVFYTETVDKSLAGRLLHEGFEVWLLDHGLSTSLIHAGGYKPTIDDLAGQVAAAIRQIHAATNRKVRIFSHCVGSAALSMSILRGLNTLGGEQSDNPGSLIDRLVMHAIPPWIHPSETNFLRAYIGVYFKDRFFPQFIDPNPLPDAPHSTQPSGLSSLVDRIAFSLPWTKAEYDAHSFHDRDHEFGRAICNRMTAFYGYEWSHANLAERTHKEIVSLVGPTDADAFRQLYFLLTRERVTTAIGENIYLTQENIGKYWTFPTLFIHGRDNQVFNAESSILAAHQLTGFQQLQNLPPGHDRTVKLAVIEGYGHMDLLFGKNAHRDVYDWVTDFFGANVKPQTVARPKSETRAPTLPMTGPVISNPTCIDGKHRVRVWVETDEFQACEAIGVKFDPVGCAGAPPGADGGHRDPCSGARSTEMTGANLLKNSRFWLTEVECDTASVFKPRVLNREPGLRAMAGAIPETIAATPVAAAAPGAIPYAIAATPAWAAAVGAIPDALAATPDGTATAGAIPAPIAASSAAAGSIARLTDSAPDADASWIMDWRNLRWFTRFMSGDFQDSVSFVVGSCWYPGSWFDHDISDRLFAKIRDEVSRSDGIDHLLLVGDQIYADAYYAIFDIKENRERFQESYRRAFNSRHAAWVLRQVPTYFAINDNQFRDNYPSSFAGDDGGTLTGLGNAGAAEAWNFQMHHDQPPSHDEPGSRHLDNRLWHSFESAGFRFFVFDTRSERDPAANGVRRLISATQEGGFKDWARRLGTYPAGRPLFLVTGSPVVPVPDDELRHPALSSAGDSLRAFPDFLAMVARTLAQQGREHPIVWLSGDLHYSSRGRFTICDAADRPLVSCLGIVASGVNAPLPFANDRPDAIEWGMVNRIFDPGGGDIHIRIHDAGRLCVSRQHAIRVDVGRTAAGWWLQIRVVDVYGSQRARSETMTL